MENKLDKKTERVYVQRRGAVPPEKRATEYYRRHQKMQADYRNPRKNILDIQM